MSNLINSSTKNKNTAPTAPLAAFGSAEEAFARVRPELEAYAGPVRRVTADVVAMTATALGVLPKLEAFRADFSKLPAEDARAFERLADFAGALYFAHLEFRTTPAAVDDYEALHQEVVRVRELLRNDLAGCVLRGLVVENARARGRYSYRNVVADLSRLVRVFQRNWATLEGKCVTTAAELVAAETLATAALRALGEKSQAPVETSEAARLRARALTLFVDAYNRVRHALAGLRWKEGDADEIMPTLFPRTRKTPRAAEVAAPAPATSTPPATETTTTPPAANDATPGVPTAA